MFKCFKCIRPSKSAQEQSACVHIYLSQHPTQARTGGAGARTRDGRRGGGGGGGGGGGVEGKRRKAVAADGIVSACGRCNRRRRQKDVRLCPSNYRSNRGHPTPTPAPPRAFHKSMITGTLTQPRPRPNRTRL